MTLQADGPLWSTAVSNVDEGQVTIRGYALGEIIRRLSYSEATYLVLSGELPEPGAARAFDAVMCSILDHAFISSTIPAARFVASANPDPIAGLAAGVLTVGSNTVSPQDSAELIDRVLAREAAGSSMQEAAQEIVGELLAGKKRIPGLGHPTHHDEDPRAQALREVAEPLGYWAESGAAMLAIQAALASLKGRQLAINVDGAAGAVLRQLGFVAAQIRCIGALSYIPGIIAHVSEELENNRGLRYVPLEDSVYTGLPPRELTRTYGEGTLRV
jgi:citryl-CoA lyase